MANLWTVVVYLYFVVVCVLGQYDQEDLEETDVDKMRLNMFERESLCPPVKQFSSAFNIFAVLGSWYVAQYYSSSEEALTYNCMRVDFRLSRGNMDMIMRLTFRYANDPSDEIQSGNMTWQIPDPSKPEHWRHTEDHYKGIYNTDVVDTDYENWLLLLHCSDSESNKKFLSTFILSRQPQLDNLTIDYLREKVSHFHVDLEYLFPVNQTQCQENPEKLLRIPTVEEDHPILNKGRKSRRSRG